MATQDLIAQVAAVRQMQQSWPAVEVEISIEGQAQVLPAGEWVRLATGQFMNHALGGSMDLVGRFVAARRVLRRTA